MLFPLPKDSKHELTYRNVDELLHNNLLSVEAKLFLTFYYLHRAKFHLITALSLLFPLSDYTYLLFDAIDSIDKLKVLLIMAKDERSILNLVSIKEIYKMRKDR